MLGVNIIRLGQEGRGGQKEYERKFYINFIPIPPSWGGRQLWRVNQKNRRDHTKLYTTDWTTSTFMQQALTIFNSRCIVQCRAGRGGSLVHYSQGVRISNFHRFFTKPPTPPCISSHPPPCICVFYYLSLVLWVWGEKIGNWVLDFCPHPASSKFWRKWELSHFGGNRKHKKRWRWWILVVYAPETQRVMQFRKLTKCWLCTLCKHDNAHIIYKTSQELRILSSVTLNCQVTKIVMKSGSQFSILLSVCQISQVSRISLRVLSKCIYLCHCLCLFICLCHCPF